MISAMPEWACWPTRQAGLTPDSSHRAQVHTNHSKVSQYLSKVRVAEPGWSVQLQTSHSCHCKSHKPLGLRRLTCKVRIIIMMAVSL